MTKELDNIFVDVRNAFRLLNRYQKRILHAVTYIREQTGIFHETQGAKWFSHSLQESKNKQLDIYLNRIRKDMWGWDFLDGYMYEYFLGKENIEEKEVCMSVFQVSDDGYFISEKENKSETDVSSFKSAEQSHSYLILDLQIDSEYLFDNNYPEEKPDVFIRKFLSSTELTKITLNKKNEAGCILRKYEMQRFASQELADKVIRDFGELVEEKTGLRIFKSDFYPITTNQ